MEEEEEEEEMEAWADDENDEEKVVWKNTCSKIEGLDVLFRKARGLNECLFGRVITFTLHMLSYYCGLKGGRLHIELELYVDLLCIQLIHKNVFTHFRYRSLPMI